MWGYGVVSTQVLGMKLSPLEEQKVLLAVKPSLQALTPSSLNISVTLGMMVHTCNRYIEEAEVGELGAQDYPETCGKF